MDEAVRSMMIHGENAGGIQKAYIIVYHGGVFSKRKSDSQDYLSFRAVKEVY